VQQPGQALLHGAFAPLAMQQPVPTLGWLDAPW
jgi:hypothetical protein